METNVNDIICNLTTKECFRIISNPSPLLSAQEWNMIENILIVGMIFGMMLLAVTLMTMVYDFAKMIAK